MINPENDRSSNEEMDLLHLDDVFFIKNGLLGVNRIIFFKITEILQNKKQRQDKSSMINILFFTFNLF
jgi:hypothetical protein